MSNQLGQLTGLLGKLNENPPMLFEKFTDLDTAPDAEPWTSIRAYYSSPGPGYRAMGIIMNGVLTTNKTKFLLSKRIFDQWLVQHDGRLGKEISGKTYGRIVAQLNSQDLQFIKKLSDPSNYRSNQYRAAIYEVIWPPLLEYLKQQNK